MNISLEESRIIKVSGIGKYPFIQLSSSKIDFEQILVGKKESRDLTIKNQSEVEVFFVIKKIQEDEFKDQSLKLDILEGFIPPKSSFLIKAIFTPKIVGLLSVQNYKLESPGGIELLFTCQGYAKGFEVSLSSEKLDFGEVKIGEEI
ncbi:hypothetical protein IMG5_067390 [Ichthyophthirius multifiliis]|uniref:Abnormal spindle-like microcephaly-associated protein ASH domain-containing protein n=1 Tax=Ichthyophthirius multifiliis TaxID=5932 RepID=G0QPF6_ICHMU|nr:hypothetical protein IMG5_067390 [Ichthyophthirius multifiliis]EGR32898.1 hypothetical protein IMG5_067390 [Ichthyophthirius multifiliis]|eukprot:XP_004036884.1 hypothetical protein IMG5_067390 [Ichthyophthirius multifiliis]